MSNYKSKKCYICGKEIVPNSNDIKDVVYYNKKYYHKQCFVNYAYQQISKKRKNSSKWQESLSHIKEYESCAIARINETIQTDRLNDWLIEHYNLAVTPSKRFWYTVKDLNNGTYKGKRCKQVSTEMLVNTWVWAQKNLDKINLYNKSIGKYINGEARLNYDLAIVLNKMPIYLKNKREHELTKKEIDSNLQIDDIDMSKINNRNYKSRKDISDISNDIYVE